MEEQVDGPRYFLLKPLTTLELIGSLLTARLGMDSLVGDMRSPQCFLGLPTANGAV